MNIYKFNSILFLVLQYFYVLLLFCYGVIGYSWIWFIVVTFLFFCILIKSYHKFDGIVIYFFTTLVINLAVLSHNPTGLSYFLLLVSPLIGAFSNLNRKNIFYIIAIPIIFFLINLLLYKQVFHGDNLSDLSSSFFGFIFIGCICYVNSERNTLKVHLDNLDKKVNEFYTSSEFKKPYKLYFPIKELINEHIMEFSLFNILRSKVKVLNIHCYAISEASLVLVNGTKFLWENSLRNDSILDSLSQSNGILYNFPINGMSDNYVLLLVRNVDYDYVFVFELSEKLPYLLEKMSLFSIYRSIFGKISDLLYHEKKLFSIRKREIGELSDKRKYVSYAIKSMHFIRNRLTPFNNLTELLSYYFSSQMDLLVGKDQLLEFIKKESSNCKLELSQLIKRANYILENSRNPFGSKSIEQVSVIDVYTSLNKNFNYYFPGRLVDFKLVDSYRYKNYYAEIDREGFEIFISDWLNNCLKYSNSYIKCTIDVTNETLSIIFVNNYTVKDSEIKTLINDLNSDSRREILQRSTNGVFLVKEFLDNMDIAYNAKLEKLEIDNKSNNVLVFSITIKMVMNDESSNI